MTSNNDPSQTEHRLPFSPSQPHSYADTSGREGLQHGPGYFGIDDACTSKKVRSSRYCGAAATGALGGQIPTMPLFVSAKQLLSQKNR